jgi:branched-chain amino acid transport system ATP-binding protein
VTVEIALYGARVRHGPLEALHGVDLAVPAGRLTVLLGRNGAGRTTVLRALAGTAPLSAGRVLWRGRDVTRMPADARARRGLAFVPDRRPVFGALTVAENLALFGAAGPAGPEPALEVFPALRPLLDRPAGTLSGGEQRMLAVSRAVLGTPAPRLVLLDEPSLGLSPAAAARMHTVLAALCGPDGGRTVLVAEQRLPEGLRAATAVVYGLRRGAVVFRGEPGELTAAGAAVFRE